MIVISIVSRLTSPGPILFRQMRLGLHERPFEMLKFRTMVVNAEEQGPKYTIDNDQRITAVGRFLRQTSLDELPQLINVLRGDMSLVGPRPYIGFELQNIPSEQRVRRASDRPGMTGLAQVSGRSSLTQERALAYDLEYIDRCSLILDLNIILLTIRQVIERRSVN